MMFQNSGVDAEKTKAETIINFRATCLSHDFKESTASVHELGESKNLDCSEYTLKMESKTSVNFFLPEAKGRTNLSALEYWGTEELGECHMTKEGDDLIYSDCVEVTEGLTKVVDANEKENEFYTWSKYVYSDGFTTTSDPNRVWHKGGEITFIRDAWEGKITYSEQDVPPLVDARSGDVSYRGSLADPNLSADACTAQPVPIWVNKEGVCNRVEVNTCSSSSTSGGLTLADEDKTCRLAQADHYECYSGVKWMLSASDECVEVDVACSEGQTLTYMTFPSQQECKATHGID